MNPYDWCDKHNVKLVYAWWGEWVCPYCDEESFYAREEENLGVR